MLKDTFVISGIEVEFRASATIPRIYRAKFGRDILKDLKKLSASYNEKKENEDEDFGIEDLEMFENVAYIMAYHADNSIPSIEDWLDQFEMFSIYEVLPKILNLWDKNLQTDVEAKKNLKKVAEN